ncbi:MAG: IS110 family transposase [Oscillospiraceae bacterium]|nr:IS110 family transposase [Oscillospiraceae bacterium]
MLKIVYPICCGMDVHKSFLIACIASTNAYGVTTYQSKRFSTFTGDLRRCAAWLTEHNCKDVCMESTGKYWIPIYNILESTCKIVLAHPKYVKAIRGKKTDKKDAKWIADIFKHDLVLGSFIPPADIRQLRDLVRYRWKLTSFTTGEKNRAQNCLTVSNIKLDDVFSDVFGKAATAITTRLLENTDEKITDVSEFRTKGIKATDEQILAAVDGEICAEQAEKLRIIRSHMNSLDLCKANLESLILSAAEKYLPQLNLIMTVPGIQSFAAIGILSEIGADMSVFPTSKHLCSWAGLTPQNNESAGKKKTTRISRAGAYIKPLLVQCALCAIRKKNNPEIRKRYLNLKKRRGHKKAIIAIARMLLTIIYNILKKNEQYNSNLYTESDRPPVHREVSLDDAIFILQRQGYIVTAPT